MDKPQDKRQIKTQRLLLRAAEPSDAEALHKCFSDPETMKYWSTLPHTTMAQSQKWLESMTSNPQNGILDFIIVESTTSMPIGKIGIWSGNEIGFMIARSHWRRGLVSEALEVVLPYFFNFPRLDLIEADVDPRNEASIGILTKFGFVETGRRERTFELGGVWMDSVDLALKREDFLESR
jgi:ribosomal-protein-alanine N-acetyltransferase